MKAFWKTILERFIGPVVVGIVVLIGQFIIQPLIVEKSVIKEEIWKARFEAYSEMLRLLNRYFISIPWDTTEPGIPSDYTPQLMSAIEKRQLEERFRDNYSKIALLSNNPETVRKYIEPFSTKLAPTVFMYDLINLFRDDLGSSELDIDVADFKFIIQLPVESKEE